MGFVDVKLSDVKIEKRDSIALGRYTFRLLPGAQYRTNKNNGIEELALQAAVENDEVFAGRRVFFNFPDPTANDGKMKWSAQAMKKLEIALGEDAEEGEDPAGYFNRVALTSNNLFSAGIVNEQRKNKETGKYEDYIAPDATEPKTVLGIFTVGPAA
jgi:hypothetical protein